MIQVICFSSFLSVPGRAGSFSRDFTTRLAPECRAFSGALKIEKLKAPLIPGPEGVVDTNDWCINIAVTLKLSLQLVLLRAKKNFRHFIGYQNFINDLTKLVSSQTLAHVQLRVCLKY